MYLFLPKSLFAIGIFVLFCLLSSTAQENRLPDVKIIEQGLNDINHKARSINSRIDAKTSDILRKISNEEGKLHKRINRKNPVLAKKLFSGLNEFANLNLASCQGPLEYNGHLDSLNSIVDFIGNNNNSGNSNKHLKLAQQELKNLQKKLEGAAGIQNILQNRKDYLLKELKKAGLTKEAAKYIRQLKLFNAQIEEYKRIISDQRKLEHLFISEISKTAAFRKFFSENSELSRLFSLPSSQGNPQESVELEDMQTISSMDRMLRERFGNAGAAGMLPKINGNSGNSELENLRNKITKYKEGNFGDENLDGNSKGVDFNPERVKTFGQRLEFGYNIQSQPANYYFPVTSDLGLSIGYRVNPKNILGIGLSYKIGWGTSWKDINITHQGVSFRSFYDFKIKGSFLLTGGYELNYRSIFASMDIFKDLNNWQQSGLLGMGKQFKLKGKMKGDIKLMWDFLSSRQVPRTQSFLWRFGYKLK